MVPIGIITGCRNGLRYFLNSEAAIEYDMLSNLGGGKKVIAFLWF